MLTYTAIETIANTVAPAGAFATVEAEPEFAKKVRLASVILKANNPISYDDIRRATPGTYFRIALRIAAARFPNISFTSVDATGATTIVDNTNKINFQWLEDDIIAMLTPEGAANLTGDSEEGRLGSFSGGLEWAASKMVAAHVIRNIPLNSSSLKFVDVADTLETQALEDIDRIIRIDNATNGGSAASSSEASVVKGQANFCIAHSIDLATLPDTAFDVPDPNTVPPTYTGTISFTDVETVNTLSVQPDEVGICYFYMTGQAVSADQDLITSRAYTELPGDPKHSGSVSFKIEKAFGVITGNSDPNDPLPSSINVDELITLISDEINTETLAKLGENFSLVSNVLTAPQRGKPQTTPVSVTKRELYPDTTSNKNRRGLFSLYHRINKLSFEVRRYSNKVTTEMITIGFYTVPLSVWQDYIITPEVNRDPRILRSSGRLGIEGLIFGETDSYSQLGNIVPYSALLNVEKGNVATVSIDSAASAEAEAADNIDGSSASDAIDTFYFAYEDTNTIDKFISPFTSDLTFRLSTTSYITSIPLNITVDLTNQPFTNPNFTGNLDIPVGEQVASRVVDAIYEYTRNSNIDQDSIDNANVLGVLLGDYQRITTLVNASKSTAAEIPLEPYIDATDSLDIQPNFSSVQKNSSTYRDTVAGRVQMVAFRYRDEEYRVVIEILSIPPNLWIATGNSVLRRTQWVLGRRRAITAETKVLSSGTVAQQTTAEELSSVNASVGKAEATKSQLLQRVFDKRRLLQEAQKGFPTKWHYPT